ncbi:hypothetical protein Syun_014211 [Stephania yunnanensis]|uniref:Uncharacterized protein n=1 Tax=Stephania yunnanensis TaxID=152371 RepID=A0AAP0JJZ4_9MAGN
MGEENILFVVCKSYRCGFSSAMMKKVVESTGSDMLHAIANEFGKSIKVSRGRRGGYSGGGELGGGYGGFGGGGLGAYRVIWNQILLPCSGRSASLAPFQSAALLLSALTSCMKQSFLSQFVYTAVVLQKILSLLESEDVEVRIDAVKVVANIAAEGR